MSLALATASRLKPEIRLAVAVSEFEADLSAEQKNSFRTRRFKSLSSPPSAQDVMRLTAEIDRASGRGGRCLGPRLTNLLEAVQKFASLGDIVIGGSQNLVACGVWTIVRMSLLLMKSFSSHLERISELFMIVGRYAPRFEALALLYPKSRDLQSSLSEYFIVVVKICHELLNFTRKSNLQKIGASLSDASLAKHQKDLESWGLAIREEVDTLLMVKVHEEAKASSYFRGVSATFFKTASYRERFQIRQQILDFCSKYDATAVWKQVRKAGNTNSFRQTLEYESWRRALNSSTLIYTGKLGSGKSVLLANLVDDLHLANGQKLEKIELKEIITFFFCRYDMPETLKASTIVGSLSRQILSQIPDITNLLELQESSEGLPQSERLVSLVYSATFPTNKIFAVIDGIDELDETERSALLQTLKLLQETRKVFICFSHRQDANGMMNFDSGQLARVQTTSMPNNTTEIESYIENELQRRVKSSRLAVGNFALLLEIKGALVQGSDGMFLWAVLQIEALCAMQTDEAIREALSDLPSGLSETFRRILQSSAKSGDTYQRPILELITVAQRPLSREELREALSVTPGDTTWNPTRALNNIHATLACCGGLVVMDEEQFTLSFVHHSVKQYLLGDFEESGDSPTIDFDGHKRMCEIIVTYLNYSDFDRQVSAYVLPQMGTIETMGGIVRSTKNSVGGITGLALKMIGPNGNQSDFNMAKAFAEAQRKRPQCTNQFFFREYALGHWEPHVVGSSPLEINIFHLFQSLLDKKIITTLPSLDQGQMTQFFEYAVIFGITSAVESLLDSEDIDINRVIYPHGRTALHMAVICGYTDIPTLFIQRKGSTIDINIEDDYGETAIDIARENESFSLMETLSFFAEHSEASALGYCLQAKRILLESISDVRYELEGSPGTRLAADYYGKPVRSINTVPRELEGDTEWPTSMDLPLSEKRESVEVDQAEDNDSPSQSLDTLTPDNRESWEARRLNAEYLALEAEKGLWK